MSARWLARLPLTGMQLRMQRRPSPPVPPPPTILYVRVNDFAWAITIPSFVSFDTKNWEGGNAASVSHRAVEDARRDLFDKKNISRSLCEHGRCTAATISRNPWRKSSARRWWNSASWNKIVSAYYAFICENFKCNVYFYNLHIIIYYE